ncbi:MAG: GNAT family N-acetyltransferase [Candidatus Latescibacterota bacterium]
MFTMSRFTPRDARPLADFLNDLRQNHWSLTSLAYMRRPATVPLVAPADLVAGEMQALRIGTWLLRCGDRIISMLQLDDRDGDGRVALFSCVETHPEYQRRGTFWRHLGEPCLRQICARGYEVLEAQTWPLNRKGIPLYKRFGFRGVPGTALRMENYLPLIIRHPGARPFLARHDYLRALQCRRSYGYDGSTTCRLSVFAYHWQAGLEQLRVTVDRERQQVVAVQTDAWSVWCFVSERTPHCVFYYVRNRTRQLLPYRVRVRSTADPGPGLLRRLASGRSVSGHFRLCDPSGGPPAGMTVEFELGGLAVPFRLCRQKRHERREPTVSQAAG